MAETLKDPVIKRCCEAPNRLADLQHISEGLEKCQKSLNDYLDSKRNAFPRFFFISDDELLSILGNSDPLCVQEHMIKVGPRDPTPAPWERLPTLFQGGLFPEAQGWETLLGFDRKRQPNEIHGV